MAAIGASRVGKLRRLRGFSQRTLGDAASITRQAVGAIESGRMQPSVGIALRLAHALGTSVEALFDTAERPPKAVRTASATIAGRLVTHALAGDGLATEPSESPLPTIFVAGCELSAGLLSRHAMSRSRDVRVVWLAMTNRAALDALAHGNVHAAVAHTAPNERTHASNSQIRFELATTEAGWLFAAGNPLALRGAADLTRRKLRLANRPAGAGARRLLDEQLRHAAVDPDRIVGYGNELAGQLDAARAVAQGFADAAIGAASAASTFGLTFVPLRAERCALLVPAATARTLEIRTLLDALRSAPYRRELEAFGAYDVSKTGERIA